MSTYYVNLNQTYLPNTNNAGTSADPFNFYEIDILLSGGTVGIVALANGDIIRFKGIFNYDLWTWNVITLTALTFKSWEDREPYLIDPELGCSYTLYMDFLLNNKNIIIEDAIFANLVIEIYSGSLTFKNCILLTTNIQVTNNVLNVYFYGCTFYNNSPTFLYFDDPNNKNINVNFEDSVFSISNQLAARLEGIVNNLTFSYGNYVTISLDDMINQQYYQLTINGTMTGDNLVNWEFNINYNYPLWLNRYGNNNNNFINYKDLKYYLFNDLPRTTTPTGNTWVTSNITSGWYNQPRYGYGAFYFEPLRTTPTTLYFNIDTAATSAGANGTTALPFNYAQLVSYMANNVVGNYYAVNGDILRLKGAYQSNPLIDITYDLYNVKLTSAVNIKITSWENSNPWYIKNNWYNNPKNFLLGPYSITIENGILETGLYGSTVIGLGYLAPSGTYNITYNINNMIFDGLSISVDNSELNNSSYSGTVNTNINGSTILSGLSCGELQGISGTKRSILNVNVNDSIIIRNITNQPQLGFGDLPFTSLINNFTTNFIVIPINYITVNSCMFTDSNSHIVSGINLVLPTYSDINFPSLSASILSSTSAVYSFNNCQFDWDMSGKPYPILSAIPSNPLSIKFFDYNLPTTTATRQSIWDTSGYSIGFYNYNRLGSGAWNFALLPPIDNNSETKIDYIEISGPILVGRYGTNRLINLTNFLPQYVQQTDTKQFLQVFETYLNEMFDGESGFLLSNVDKTITKNYATSGTP